MAQQQVTTATRICAGCEQPFAVPKDDRPRKRYCTNRCNVVRGPWRYDSLFGQPKPAQQPGRI